MIDSISPVSVNKVAFKGEVSAQQTEIKEPEQKSNKSWMLWTGLAVLAAGGIYLATRGKAGKENVGKGAEPLKEMTVDAFKKAGNKYEKIRAKLVNGENYTGTLIQTTKDGKTIVREYKDGMLQKTVKKEGENIISSRSYAYDEKGMLTEIKDDIEKIPFAKPLYSARVEGDYKMIETPKSKIIKNLKTGKIVMQQIGDDRKSFYYGGNGKLKYVQHEYMDSSYTRCHDIIAYYPDGKNKRFVKHGNDHVESYDKKGKLTDKIFIDGNWYTSDGFSYKKEFYAGSKRTVRSYNLFDPDDSTAPGISLNIKKRPDTYLGKMFFCKDEKRYIISSDFGGKNVQIREIEGNEISESTDKELWDELIADSKKYAEEFKAKLKKALRLRNEVQLADREISNMILRNAE